MLILEEPWDSQPQEAVGLSDEFAGNAIHVLNAAVVPYPYVYDAANGSIRAFSGYSGGTLVAAGGSFVGPGGIMSRTDRVSSAQHPLYAGVLNLGTKVSQRHSTGKFTMLGVFHRESGLEQMLIGTDKAGVVAANCIQHQWWSDNKHYLDVGDVVERMVATDAATGHIVVLMSFDSSTNTKRIWSGGRLLIEDSADTDDIAAGTATYYAVTNGLAFYGLSLFDTVFAPGVEQSLANQPWRVFAPRSIPIPTAAAAAGLPTLSAPTYVPGSILTNGWRPRFTATY